ncbi:LacI family DNA-binding transcriptional regulator [Novosphingobium sp.]|uniref:LacI family DNA-binding transcriptional regulator n=1 Tax=Novosphingobium sp. TaxID=1874826 RepID=UPI00286D7311|nr:LacI family DNA-binding transcriptional regulator [Novosphingobium sp.]
MNTTNQTITLDQVAAAAGVSPATVSRFFNTPGIVARATAERIREAVEQLGYIPNLLAGGLASNRSRLVAVMIPELSGSIFVDMIEAMIEELSSHGYVVMLLVTGLKLETPSDMVRAALGRRPEAVVVTGAVDGVTRSLLRKSGTSVIELWDLPAEPVDVAIGFSHFAVGEALAHHVHERGYRAPHLLMPDAARAGVRRQGFLETWQALGGAEPQTTQVGTPGTLSDAHAFTDALLASAIRPDVVVCGSDLLAFGVAGEARARALRIPEDLAVVGFGNSRLSSEAIPPITSVAIDGTKVGQELAALLQTRSSKRERVPLGIDVGFELIGRASC